MNYQLIPLYIIGALCSLYTLKQAFLYYMYEPEIPYETLEHLTTNIEPTETPFMQSLRKDKYDH